MDHEEEEEVYGKPISNKLLNEVIKKNNLYITPHLNEVLYLQFLGITKIKNLSPFVNLMSLWLNNNAITVIEGLDELVNLKSLNLAHNLIEKISGLDKLDKLDTLVLSHNYISQIEGLSGCKCLTTLQLDYNKLRSPESLRNLSEVPSLQALNVNNNMIESPDFIDSIKGLKNLSVLRMIGNDVIKRVNEYKRKLMIQFPHLKYLDDAPIEEHERRLLSAWISGGEEAEAKEKELIQKEKEQKHEENMKEYEDLINQGRIERGELLCDPEDIEIDETMEMHSSIQSDPHDVD